MNSSANEVLIPFQRVSNLRGTWDLLFIYGAIFGLATLASHLHSAIFSLFAIIIIGGLQNGLVSLQHEAWHSLCFRPKKVNDLVCSWLTGYAVGASYRFNQMRHSGHHAYFGTDADPDRVTFINDGRETPFQLLRYFAYILLGGTIIERLRSIIGSKQEAVATNLPQTGSELLFIALAQMSLLVLFCLTGHWTNYFLYWFLPLVTVAAFFTTARQFIEHANADEKALPEDRLYDFDANILEQFFFAPANFHHHAFHHAYPKIPHYRLLSARELIKAKGLTYKCQLRRGYVASFVAHMSALQKDESSKGEAFTSS